jgi:hypothetical protein
VRPLDASSMRFVLAYGIALAALSAGAAQPQSLRRPANTLQELFSQLDHCMAVPKGATGSELTIVFSLRRDGSLLGRPRISFAKLSGSATDQRAFAEGVASAFDRCLRALITDGLGGAIAGRPLSMRFVVRARETSA